MSDTLDERINKAVKKALSDPIFYPEEMKSWLPRYLEINPPALRRGDIQGMHLIITGIIPATGTTPTAGTGFTYTHTDTTGVYVFSFTGSPYSATPIVVASPAGSQRILIVSNVSSSGFTVSAQALSGPGTPSDSAFAFVVNPTL